jgi:hypothetical protein
LQVFVMASRNKHPFERRFYQRPEGSQLTRLIMQQDRSMASGPQRRIAHALVRQVVTRSADFIFDQLEQPPTSQKGP